MRTLHLSSIALAASMAIAVGSAAHAGTNLIQNGDFEQSSYSQSSQFGSGYDSFGGQGVTDWTGGAGYQIYFKGNTNAQSVWPQQPQRFASSFVSSPAGSSFIALDGDTGTNNSWYLNGNLADPQTSKQQVQGSISQTVSGLTVGKTYALTFDWAAAQLVNRNGAITEKLNVSFGSDSKDTSTLDVGSQGFSGWKTVTMYFTADSTSETLQFLSIGTPTGEPPMALLDGISLTAVPEPATWAMMLIGFGGIGALIRRRGRTLAAAA